MLHVGDIVDWNNVKQWETASHYGNLTSQALYDPLITMHANVLMVVSGHVVSSAWRTNTGEQGNTIYQILQDYQGKDSGGYIRLFEIDSKAGTIAAKMYSPFYDKTLGNDSRFPFKDVEFIK